MFKIIKQIKPGYSYALENRDLKGLEGYIKRLVECYKDTPEAHRKGFGNAILEILKMKNSSGKTAVMIDISYGSGEIEEAIYLFALESENFDMLKEQINALVKAYNETKAAIRKEYGIESLNIFNLKNSRGETAVMLAAKHGKAVLLKRWYKVPEDLTQDKYSQEELGEVYVLREVSYTTQDIDGHNALMLAVKSGKSECFEFLLSPETATALNQKDKDGKIPLMHAIESGSFELIKKFLEIAGLALDQVNQYDPKNEFKFKLDTNTLNCIQNIEDENIKSIIERFLNKSKEYISRMPSSSLKRKSTEQGNGTLEKKRKEEITVKTVLQEIQKVLDELEKVKDTIGSTGLVKVKEWINSISAKKYITELTKDCKNEIHKKLKELEGELKKTGQLILTKLLNEANLPELTDKKKKEIIGHIKDLVIKADIDFPEDQIQNIPTNIINEVLDILNAPNPQLHSTRLCEQNFKVTI